MLTPGMDLPRVLGALRIIAAELGYELIPAQPVPSPTGDPALRAAVEAGYVSVGEYVATVRAPTSNSASTAPAAETAADVCSDMGCDD